jgi:hypothetical protein
VKRTRIGRTLRQLLPEKPKPPPEEEPDELAEEPDEPKPKRKEHEPEDPRSWSAFRRRRDGGGSIWDREF